MKIGIVGYGRFGRLWASALIPFGEVIIYDNIPLSKPADGAIKMASLPEVAHADLIFILTPISQFENACVELNQFVKSDSLIMDACSVKVYPSRIMQKIFSKDQSLIATHPLFGPDSVSKNGGLTGHKIVVCPIRCNQTKLDFVINLFKQMGLNSFIKTPKEHDKHMADSQGLVHFIGRGLATLGIKQQSIATPDFQALLNINNMVINDSWQLFLDMHRYNPYAKAIRNELIQAFININKEIDDNEIND